MAIVRWDPFRELSSLHEQVNSLFDESFGDIAQLGRMAPTTDIYKDDKELTIEAHLPNFKEDEIMVDEHQGALEIKAEHKESEEKNKKGKKYLVRESVSQYYRRFALPNNADADKIKAHYENGLLKVTVPFKALPKPKHIAIKAKN